MCECRGMMARLCVRLWGACVNGCVCLCVRMGLRVHVCGNGLCVRGGACVNGSAYVCVCEWEYISCEWCMCLSVCECFMGVNGSVRV